MLFSGVYRKLLDYQEKSMWFKVSLQKSLIALNKFSHKTMEDFSSWLKNWRILKGQKHTVKQWLLWKVAWGHELAESYHHKKK